MKKVIKFKLQDITELVHKIIKVQKSKSLAFKRASYIQYKSPLQDFVLSSALLNRYNVLRTYNNTNHTITQDHINNALHCIRKFDIIQYKGLPLVLQYFVMFCGALQSHGIKNTDVVHLVNKLYSRTDIAMLLGRQLNITAELHDYIVDSTIKCAKCGQRLPLNEDELCEECVQKLHNTIEYRRESFYLYGTCYRNFSTSIKDFNITATDLRFNFELTSSTNEIFEPCLPFVEYQDNVSIL